MVLIRCISKQTTAIGKKIAKSKTKTTWQFEIEGIKSWVTLILSHYSRKYVILLNGIEHKSGVNIFGGIEHRFKYLEVSMLLKTNFKQKHLYLNSQEFDAYTRYEEAFDKKNKKPTLFGSKFSHQSNKYGGSSKF